MIYLIFTIIFIYMLYYIWIAIHYNRRGERKGKNKKKNNKQKMPAEVEYFVTKYKVDLSKINFRYFLQLMGLVVAFDLSIVVTIITYIKTLWIQLLVGFVLTLLITLTSFHILGKYFKKKGLTKDV